MAKTNATDRCQGATAETAPATGQSVDPTHFHAGWNMPGYLPEMEPATFASFDDARQFVVEEMVSHSESVGPWSEEHDCDDVPCPTFGDDCQEQKAANIRLTAEDANLESGPFEVCAGDLVYWVSECSEPDCIGEEEETEPPTVWQLARLAGVSDPDSLESPGATWLRRVFGSFEEMDTSADIDDELHERADGLVPIYTHERWQVFVDLAAYEVADEAREDGLLSADASMTDAAGVALYVVAGRLLSALLTERQDA